MQQALDSHGDFHVNNDGTLIFDDLKILRQVILR